MNKYVIELDKNVKEVVVISLEDGDMWTETMEVEDLEQLNSDYINEHYGSLQGEAYQRGLEEGKQVAVGAAELREKLEYQKGFKDGKAQSEKGCGGCMWEDKDYNTCSICCNSYKNMYEAKKADDEIKVGDELEHTVSGYTSKAIFLEKIGNDEDEDWYKCLFWTGCGVAILSYPKRQFKRTGNHFDIDKILEAMKK